MCVVIFHILNLTYLNYTQTILWLVIGLIDSRSEYLTRIGGPLSSLVAAIWTYTVNLHIGGSGLEFGTSWTDSQAENLRLLLRSGEQDLPCQERQVIKVKDTEQFPSFGKHRLKSGVICTHVFGCITIVFYFPFVQVISFSGLDRRGEPVNVKGTAGSGLQTNNQTRGTREVV